MKTIFFKTILYITSLFWILTIINIVISSNTHFDFFNQSMFINYSQGFVRRGLLGEFFKKMHILTNINIFLLIKIFCLSNYLFFIAFVSFNFFKKKLSYAFLFLPYILPYYAFIGFINAKDFFLLNLFLIQLFILKKIKNIFLKIILLNSVSILGILTHEIFFFISIPILIYHLIIEKKQLIKLDILLYAISFTPSLIVTLLSVYYHGDQHIAILIYQDILSYIPKDTQNLGLDGGIGCLGEHAENKIKYVFKDRTWNGFSRGVSYSVYLITLVYILLNLNKINVNLFRSKENSGTINPINTAFIFIFQTLCLFPIYCVAIDWQRWISIALYQAIAYNVYFNHTTILPYAKKLEFLKKGYSYFINSSKGTVLLISAFCIIPYFKFGNTPYQFNNIFMIFMNFISKVIAVTIK